MSEPDLRRLLANHAIAERLSSREQEILQRAARGSWASICGLYGFANQAAAERAVQAIRAKLEGDGAPAAAPDPPRSAPPPASRSSAGNGVAPARAGGRAAGAEARLLALFVDCAELTQKQAQLALGLGKSTTAVLFKRLEVAGEVHVARKDGRVGVYRRGPERAPEPPRQFAGLGPVELDHPVGLRVAAPDVELSDPMDALRARYCSILLDRLELVGESPSPSAAAAHLQARIDLLLGLDPAEPPVSD